MGRSLRQRSPDDHPRILGSWPAPAAWHNRGMAVASTERLRSDLVQLIHGGGGGGDFSLGPSCLVARAVPFDGVCLVTMDPATLLPTGEVVDNGLPPEATARLTEIELQ